MQGNPTVKIGQVREQLEQHSQTLSQRCFTIDNLDTRVFLRYTDKEKKEGDVCVAENGVWYRTEKIIQEDIEISKYMNESMIVTIEPPDSQKRQTQQGSLWQDMAAAEAHAKELTKSISDAIDRSENHVPSYCCFHYRAEAGKLRRPGSCKFGHKCKFLHAHPRHTENLILRYGMICDREQDLGGCKHRQRREHP